MSDTVTIVTSGQRGLPGNDGAPGLPVDILATAPVSPTEGYTYYNTTDHKLWYWNGTAWVDVTAASLDSLGDVVIDNINLEGGDAIIWDPGTSKWVNGAAGPSGYIDVTAAPYNATGDGSTDDTAAIQAAIDAAEAGNIKTVYFPTPASYYKCASALDLSSTFGLTLIGEGGRTELKDDAAVCPIIYTGSSGDRFIDIKRTRGLRLEGLDIRYNNASFTGDLLSSNFNVVAGNVGYNLSVRNCTFSSTSAAITSARSGMYLAGMVRAEIKDNAFYWMDWGIIGYSGAAGDTPYSTAVILEKNWFNQLVLGGVANPHQQWVISNNVFEPLHTSGNAGGIKCGVLYGGLSGDGLLVIGNGFWDVTSQSGAWIEFGSVGLIAIGNYVNVGSAATFIKAISTCSGITVQGNRVTGSSGATFVDLNGQTGTQYSDDGTNTVDAGITLLANSTNFSRSAPTFGKVTTASLQAGGLAGTAIASTGAGTSPTITVTGGQLGGLISVTTGSSPASSANVTAVAWALLWSTAPKAVILTPVNAAAAALTGNAQVYVDRSQTTTDRFFLKVGSTALAGSTTYEWAFVVVL